MTKDLENKVSKIKEFFNQLEFEESTHTYKVLGEQLSSASSTISNFYDPFDTDRVAGFVAKKRGITKEEVLKEWDDKRDFACHKGHVVHAFGEDYMFDRTREKDYPEFGGYMDAIINFWNSLPSHIVPAIAELKMYSKQFNLAGTADIILYDKNRKGFIIADYKTNIDLFKNFKGKKLKAPFVLLYINDPECDDCSLTTLRLSVSQALLKEVREGRLVILLVRGSGLLTSICS